MPRPGHGFLRCFPGLAALVALATVMALAATGGAIFPSGASAAPRASETTAKMGTRGRLPRVPRSFVGVISDDALWGTDADPTRSKTMNAIRTMGAGTVRVPFLWSRLESSPGRYDFELYDGFMSQAAKSGLSVLPVLFDPPAHRSSRPASGAARGVYPPANNGDFAALAAALVRRYGPNGGFWRAHPELPQRPIRAWQVWNEPNLRQYWPAGPNPAAYAAMLKVVGPAIRAADPRADVVSAGLNESESGIPLSRFLRGMYRARARGSFTTLGIHPYARNSTGVVAQLRRARSVMKRYRDRAGIRITEIGWATGGPTAHRRVSEASQAKLTRQTIERVLRLRRSFRIKGVCVFNWRDAPPPAGARDHWGLHTGLLARNGRPKPVAYELSGLLSRVITR